MLGLFLHEISIVPVYFNAFPMGQLLLAPVQDIILGYILMISLLECVIIEFMLQHVL